MNSISVFWSDLKGFFTNRKSLIQFIGIMMIPVIYSGMFLYAFWNPYGRTDQLPVAVVNEDQGAELAGKTIDIGSDVTDKLKTDDGFDWVITSQSQARKGFKDNKYFMVVTIPEKFSEDASTFGKDKTKKPALEYAVNRDFNYIAAKIGESGVKALKNNIASTVTETYAKAMYDQLDELTSGLKEASNGASDLHEGDQKELDGLISLKNHYGDLVAGISSLSEGAKKLAGGADDLHSGLNNLQAATDELYDKTSSQTEQIKKLSEGASELSDHLEQLDKNMKALDSAHQQLTDGTAGLSRALDANVASLENTLSTYQKLSQQIDGIKFALGQLNTASKNLDQLSKKMQDLSTQAAGVNDGYQKNVNDYLSAHPEAKNDPAFQKIEAAGDQFASVSKGIGQLSGSLEQMPDLSGSIQTLSDGLKQMKNFNAASLADNMTQLQASVQKLNAGMQAFQTKLDQVPDATGKLAAGGNQLSGGTSGLNDNWSSLVTGIQQLSAGENALVDGSASLEKNLNDLTEGVDSLKTGAGKLDQGIDELKNGQSKLTDGSGSLAGHLSDAHQKLADTPKDNEHAKMLAGPLKLLDATHAKVNNYGSGFAPYFISLGLYVGALMLTVIYDLRETSRLPRSGLALGGGKLMMMGLMGVLQAIVADMIVLFGLGLEVSSISQFILFSLLTSLTFMALIQLLAATLGNPGRFIGIVILILQLTTSGGTYPVQLIPGPLHWVGRFLPMTYSIQGFKNIIAGHEQGMLLGNTLVLTGFLILFVLATMIFYAGYYKKRIKKADQSAA